MLVFFLKELFIPKKGEIFICKIGDIIVIREFKDENNDIVSKHSFVVISDKTNSIQGLKYDFVSNMMCSFHNSEHKKSKLRFRQNLLVNKGDTYGEGINGKEGYIKVNKVYYFDKNKIQYYVIAHLDGVVLKRLFETLSILYNDNKLEVITTNL